MLQPSKIPAGFEQHEELFLERYRRLRAWALQLADNDFMNDAIEGLENVKDKKDINFFVEQLNRNLHKKLLQKQKRKHKRKLLQQRWVYAAIVLILALLVATWLLIIKYQALKK